MNKTEEMAFKIRVDLDLLDLLKNEITKTRKFIKQEHTRLTPDRREAVFEALNLFQNKSLGD